MVNYSYSSGQLSQVSGPKGQDVYGYTAFAVPGAATAAGGMFTGLAQMSLLTSVTSPNGFVTSFTYGPPHQVVDYKTMALTPGGSIVYTAGTADLTDNKGYYVPLLANGTYYTVDTPTFAQWYFPQRFLTLSETGPMGTWTFDHTIDQLLETGSTIVTDPLGNKGTYPGRRSTGRR